MRRLVTVQLILLLFTTSFLFTIQEVKSNTTVVRLDPATVVFGALADYCIGETFTLTARIDDVDDLYGFGFKIEWNITYLDYVSHVAKVPVETFPDGLLHDRVAVVRNEANATKGIYELAATSLSPAPAFYGSGIAFEITFSVKYQPLKHEQSLIFSVVFTKDDLASSSCCIPHMTEHCEVTIHPRASQFIALLGIQPKVLNLKSQARYLTVYIELPEEYDENWIDVSSIMLNDTFDVDPESPFSIGDYNNNGNLDLMVNFNRTSIAHYILSQILSDEHVILRLTGKLHNTTSFHEGIIFEGNSVLKVSVLSGDVNCDARVSIYDLILAARAHSSNEDDPKWNPNANFSPHWNIIDLFDIVTIASHYGEEYIP